MIAPLQSLKLSKIITDCSGKTSLAMVYGRGAFQYEAIFL